MKAISNIVKDDFSLTYNDQPTSHWPPTYTYTAFISLIGARVPLSKSDNIKQITTASVYILIHSTTVLREAYIFYGKYKLIPKEISSDFLHGISANFVRCMDFS